MGSSLISTCQSKRSPVSSQVDVGDAVAHLRIVQALLDGLGRVSRRL